MRKTILLLQKYATGRFVATLFVLTMGVYCLMLFYTIPTVVSQAPHLKLFDMSPTGYTAEFATELLNDLGAQGRRTYLSLQLPVDFIYPGLFALTYSLLLVWLFGKSFKADSNIYYLTVVPILAGGFDYLENIGIISMLTSFPVVDSQTVVLTSSLTVLKSAFTVFFYFLMLIGAALALKNRSMHR